MRYPPRKRIRLPLATYAVPGSVWHVTIDVEDRRPVLAEYRVAQIVVEELKRQTEFRDADLLLYCVMPDHVHAVIQIGTVDLISIIRSFKAYVSSRCTQEGLPSKFWQARFYDRGVRESDDMNDLIKYILANPVDEGLVDDWTDYPWIGGSLLS